MSAFWPVSHFCPSTVPGCTLPSVKACQVLGSVSPLSGSGSQFCPGPESSPSHVLGFSMATVWIRAQSCPVFGLCFSFVQVLSGPQRIPIACWGHASPQSGSGPKYCASVAPCLSLPRLQVLSRPGPGLDPFIRMGSVSPPGSGPQFCRSLTPPPILFPVSSGPWFLSGAGAHYRQGSHPDPSLVPVLRRASS